MCASHQRSLEAARIHHEPAGQIAARELELVRIRGTAESRGAEHRGVRNRTAYMRVE
jgi:hypothetical protein